MREILTRGHQDSLTGPLFLSQLKFAIRTGQLKSVLLRCDLRATGLRFGDRHVLLLGRPIGDCLRISGQRRSSYFHLLKGQMTAIATWLYVLMFTPLQKAFRFMLDRSWLR
jgi:hypothetical protein